MTDILGGLFESGLVIFLGVVTWITCEIVEEDRREKHKDHDDDK